MANQTNFDDQSLESTYYNSDLDPDYEPCGFVVRKNIRKKHKKHARRSSSPIASSSNRIDENALSDCFEESSVLLNQENCVKFNDKGVQVNPKNLPRRKSIKHENVVKVTRSTTKRMSVLPTLETLIESEEVSSQIMQADEDNQVMNSMNESLREISETHLEPQTGSENINDLYIQNTQIDGLNSSRISLDIPSFLCGISTSENNTENNNENPPENQEIKKTINLNINVSYAENNIITRKFSFEIPMDDNVEKLNITCKPIEPAKQETGQPIPSTSNEEKKVPMDNSTSDSDGKKSKKKKSKGKKKYSKKRSKYYSPDGCSCSDCFYSSYSSYSSSSDECCICTIKQKKF